MTTLQLKTFQPLPQVARLKETGTLTGDWDRICSCSWTDAYRGMVSNMATHGIDCAGNPPIWAWWGPLTLGDAFLLYDLEHDLPQGFATITFNAPTNLVFLSDYDEWNDALFPYTPWTPAPLPPTPGQQLQATLPYLDLAWVTGISPLPTADFYELDWDSAV